MPYLLKDMINSGVAILFNRINFTVKSQIKRRKRFIFRGLIAGNAFLESELLPFPRSNPAFGIPDIREHLFCQQPSIIVYTLWGKLSLNLQLLIPATGNPPFITPSLYPYSSCGCFVIELLKDFPHFWRELLGKVRSRDSTLFNIW